MKSALSLLTFVATLLLITFLLNLGCSSLASVPQLKDRTLRISRDKPQLEYQYETCTGKFLGICTNTEMKKETYDLQDDAVRHQLVDMGFVARVRD